MLLPWPFPPVPLTEYPLSNSTVKRPTWCSGAMLKVLGDGADQFGGPRSGWCLPPGIHREVEQVVPAVPDEPDRLAVFRLPAGE